MEKTPVIGKVASICYLIEEDKVLFIKFKKKWRQVYCVPGGKSEIGESPLECIKREFKEETGLDLINPKLKGISYWNWIDKVYGLIFIYIANEYNGVLERETEEGVLEWLNIKDIPNLNQFDMNAKFNEKIFSEGLFEGHFKLNEDDTVNEYHLTDI